MGKNGLRDIVHTKYYNACMLVIILKHGTQTFQKHSLCPKKKKKREVKKKENQDKLVRDILQTIFSNEGLGHNNLYVSNKGEKNTFTKIAYSSS